MDEKILYSFIIPHKNNPILLNRCLDSIPERNDIQIIVVDDNSDSELLPQIKRNGVNVVYLEESESRGAGRARNVGLREAIGKWLLFPDCDDYYKKDFIRCLDSYSIYTDVDIIYFNFEYRDGKSNHLLPPLRFKNSFDNFDNSKKMEDEIKYHHNVPWTKMIRRSFVEKEKLAFEEVPNGNDILFSMLAGFYAKSILVEKSPLYVYLRNENSIVNSRKKSSSARACKLLHTLQQGNFYVYIGHPEWKISAYRVFMSNLKEGGLSFLVYIIMILPQLIKRSGNWVSLISSSGYSSNCY